MSSDRHSMVILGSDATERHAVHRAGFSLPKSLQRALRTLRAVRQRYEKGRNAHPDARSYSLHVVVDHSDVAWITAAIEAVEKAIAAGAPEGAGSPAEARPET
jgi:hypothetical protein